MSRRILKLCVASLLNILCFPVLRYEIENRLRAVYAQYKIRLCAVFVKYGFGCISRHKRSVKVVFVSKLNQAINMQIDLFTERK